MLNDYWLEIDPDQYLGDVDDIDLKYDKDEEIDFDCYLKIVDGYDLEIGPLALDGYYVIHDQDN